MPSGNRRRSTSAKRLAKLGLTIAYALQTNGVSVSETSVMGTRRKGRIIVKSETGRTVELNEEVNTSRHKPAPVMGLDREFLYAPIPRDLRKEGQKYLSRIDADYLRRNGLPRYEDQ